MYSTQRTMNFSYSEYSSITHYLWLSPTSCVGPSVLYRSRAKRCKSNRAGNKPSRRLKFHNHGEGPYWVNARLA